MKKIYYPLIAISDFIALEKKSEAQTCKSELYTADLFSRAGTSGNIDQPTDIACAYYCFKYSALMSPLVSAIQALQFDIDDCSTTAGFSFPNHYENYLL